MHDWKGIESNLLKLHKRNNCHNECFLLLLWVSTLLGQYSVIAAVFLLGFFFLFGLSGITYLIQKYKTQNSGTFSQAPMELPRVALKIGYFYGVIVLLASGIGLIFLFPWILAVSQLENQSHTKLTLLISLMIFVSVLTFSGFFVFKIRPGHSLKLPNSF